MRLKKSIKRGIAAVTITGIMASSAMPAFAKDYHIDYGDIKVDQDKVSYTDKDGAKHDNEKNEDGDITITGKSNENTVSVKDADVTFKDLEIDRSASSTAADGAAVSVSGNSSIELDGKNTISSGMGHAGIEKADDNGTMTIKDDNNVSGSLTANGGFGGAGIGGGNNADGSDITITGGNVTANGGTAGAGIGGGDGDNANGLNKESDSTGGGRGSNITISGKNTIVKAEGGAEAAGIGGGRSGDADTIEITDSTVISNGHGSDTGNSGAGIGGGRGGKGENVTISGSSTVSVKHGPGATLTSGTCYGAGAGIGNGGGKDDVRGEEIAPDISGIDSTGQGYINYYDSDNNLLTRVPSAPAPEENDSEGDDAEPALSASMKQAVSQLEVRGALRQNLMQDTSIVQQDYDADAHVLTIRAELSIATLTGTLGSLKALQAQGVTTIALVTQHCTSTLDLAELTALGGEDTVFSLVHTAGIPALSVGGALHNELIH